MSVSFQLTVRPRQRARAMDLASVSLTLFVNIFFRKSFAFRYDLLQLVLLAGLSISPIGSVSIAFFASAFVAVALGKMAFTERFSNVSLLLPNWDNQVHDLSQAFLLRVQS